MSRRPLMSGAWEPPSEIDRVTRDPLGVLCPPGMLCRRTAWQAAACRRVVLSAAPTVCSASIKRRQLGVRGLDPGPSPDSCLLGGAAVCGTAILLCCGRERGFYCLHPGSICPAPCPTQVQMNDGRASNNGIASAASVCRGHHIARLYIICEACVKLRAIACCIR